ncbi:MAG: hypothetical protein PUD80_07010 [Firmicutes bacterium]|nr:hypothetical protein [Bacillota bacterium]
MKLSKFFSGVFGVLGMLLMVATVMLCVLSRNTRPRMLESPEAASTQAQRMMDALCAGDYETAASCMYGQPSLGAGTPDDAVSRLIWDAFTDSLSYEFTGLCYVTDSGLARNASVTALDVAKVTASLPERAKELLKERAEAAEDKTEVYDEHNAYRAELVDEALLDAARQALDEDAETVTRDVTLSLIYRDRAWWVTPDAALLEMISGLA